MPDKPQLGLIRVSTRNGNFDMPYFADTEFDELVRSVRSMQCLHAMGQFYVPYHAIIQMVKIPNQTVTSSTFEGLTKQ